MLLHKRARWLLPTLALGHILLFLLLLLLLLLLSLVLGFTRRSACAAVGSGQGHRNLGVHLEVRILQDL